jgi:FkbM family methyltransferase
MGRLSRLHRYLSPHGLTYASVNAREFMRLGVTARVAWRWGFSTAKGTDLDRSNFRLLPDGALAKMATVVDVGANHGYWATHVLSMCRPVRYLAVEASPLLQAELSARLRNHVAVEVAPVAAGRAAGRATFHLTADDAGASLLRPRSAEMRSVYGAGFEVAQAVEVEVRTVGELTAGWDRISLLKIDVQGAELDVLMGAKKILPRTDFVMLEVTFTSHYEGDSSFGTLHDFMSTHGFALCDMSRPYVRQGRALWADAVYRRLDS